MRWFSGVGNYGAAGRFWLISPIAQAKGRLYRNLLEERRIKGSEVAGSNPAGAAREKQKRESKMKITITPKDIETKEDDGLCPIARAYLAAGGIIPEDDEDD